MYRQNTLSYGALPFNMLLAEPSEVHLWGWYPGKVGLLLVCPACAGYLLSLGLQNHALQATQQRRPHTAPFSLLPSTPVAFVNPQHCPKGGELAAALHRDTQS